MLLSLESPNAGALVVPLAGAVLPHRYGQGRAVLPGSKNRANGHWGSPENLGGPVVSTGSYGVRGGRRTRITPGPAPLRLEVVGANGKAHRVVPPSEGNEARREGRQDVVAP
jgi:hypothetical protein